MNVVNVDFRAISLKREADKALHRLRSLLESSDSVSKEEINEAIAAQSDAEEAYLNHCVGSR